MYRLNYTNLSKKQVEDIQTRRRSKMRSGVCSCLTGKT